MEILPLQFKTLSYCGFWSENNNFLLIKSIHKFFVIFVIFHFTTSEAIEFIRTCALEEDSTQGLFLSATFISVCIKIVNFLLHPNEMSNLVKGFQADICEAKSPDEWAILEKFTRKADSTFTRFMVFCQGSGIILTLWPILESGLEHPPLPFKTYQPYESSNSGLYITTYTLQFLAIFYGILVNASFDALMYGFILLLCAQYEILCLRLTKIGNQNEKCSMKNCVDHHVLIQDLIRRIQHFFMRTIAPLFVFSLIIFSASIFKIIQLKLLSAEFMSVVMYLLCMLFQIFLYCWYGNELTLKSKIVPDAIYSSDWLKLDSEERRCLRLIMQISGNGTILSHYGQCSLNLNTFVWIMKTSYSALNVLQQS